MPTSTFGAGQVHHPIRKLWLYPWSTATNFYVHTKYLKSLKGQDLHQQKLLPPTKTLFLKHLFSDHAFKLWLCDIILCHHVTLVLGQACVWADQSEQAGYLGKGGLKETGAKRERFKQRGIQCGRALKHVLVVAQSKNYEPENEHNTIISFNRTYIRVVPIFSSNAPS